MTAHIAWACGFLTTLGFVGFASAAQVEDSQKQIKEILSAQIENEILDTRHQQCLAIGEGNSNAMLYNEQRLQEKLNQYLRSVGVMYHRVPACTELVSAVPAIPVRAN